MPSPFPGMDPYLEQEAVWHDFHASFMPFARGILSAQVRPHFIVKIEPMQPASATIQAPWRVRLPAVDTLHLSYLEIRDRQNMRVVTVIELLSPSNKQPGPDREQYVAKRAQLLQSSVHFVELDLLRGGPRMPMENLPPCDYYALVSRADQRPHGDVWPIHLRDRLPVVPIPLTAPHGDARLDLKQVLDGVYDAAGYEDYVYEGEPRPPLKDDDALWARTFLPPVPR